MDKKRLTPAMQINRRKWWHTKIFQPEGYEERGIFLHWSFDACMFYGRPIDTRFCVNVKNPIVGTEEHVLRKLFGTASNQIKLSRLLDKHILYYPLKERYALDKQMKAKGLAMGYDAILILSKDGFKKYSKSGKLPRNTELNILKSNFEDSCIPEN